jgi:hypothetical protein
MRRLALAICALIIPAAIVSAQEEPTSKHLREGFWFQGGLGGGSMTLSCDILGEFECDGDAETGGIVRIALGGRISPVFHLGGSVDAWTKSENDVTVVYGATSLLAMIYPSPNSGFWLDFGPGVSVYQEDTPLGDIEVTSFSVIAGLGYDIRVGRMLSITPFANGLFSIAGDVVFDGVTLPDSKATPRMIEIGVALTVH